VVAYISSVLVVVCMPHCSWTEQCDIHTMTRTLLF